MAFRSSWSPNFSRLTRTSAVTGGSLGNNTLACWFRLDDLAANYEFIQIDTPGESDYQALIKYDAGVGGLTFLQRNSNGSDIAEAGTGGGSDPVIPTTSGVWHHVAMTWDGSTLAAYVDGVQVRTKSGTPGTRGTWTDLNVGPCLGDLQDAVFYNAALSAAEIAALYSARLPKRRNNLLVHLPCFPGSNRTVDYSGLGNNFTATGSPADSSVAPPPVGWGSGRAVLIVPAGGTVINADGAGLTKFNASGTPSVAAAASGAGLTKLNASAAPTVAVAAAGAGLSKFNASGAPTISVAPAGAGLTLLNGSGTAAAAASAGGEGKTAFGGSATPTVSIAAVGVGLTKFNAQATVDGQASGTGRTVFGGSATATVSIAVAGAGLTRFNGLGNSSSGGGGGPTLAVLQTRSVASQRRHSLALGSRRRLR